jgi:Rrf2 family protein
MQSCQFTFAVHVMAVLALTKGQCCSSTKLAMTVNTNPVVIRRLLVELHEAKLISTERGPAGGACLAKKPEKITLLEIYRAVDPGDMFGGHPNQPSQQCPVGRAIPRVMDNLRQRITQAKERELKRITLATVLRELGCRAAAPAAETKR